MVGPFLIIYIVFISLVALFLLALSIKRNPGQKYRTSKDYNPKVLVIIPCKGHDIGLARNLTSAKRQSHTNYDVIAVVESKGDEAVKSIKSAGLKFIISKFNCRNCSGKVRNISAALSGFRNYDAYVILDSDAYVGREWLSSVIAPLYDKRIGISTSFPTFRPIGGFWSHVKFVWGFVGLSLMEHPATRFGWGGTLAFRKDLLSAVDFKKFSESVSDDIALTSITKAKRLRIAYTPDLGIMIDSKDDFGVFWEWANRQTAFSINGSGKVFYYGVVYYSASILVLVSAIILSISINPIFLLLLLPTVAGAARTYERSKGSLAAVCIFPLINFVYLANLIKAKGMKRVTWRGRVYDIGPWR
jgi:cellulose synthase/poly-beta-1,6-N-acetylglucosamine synthase-like glycosyltransferase